MGKIAEEGNLQNNDGKIMGLYYDGRIDETLVRGEREDGKVKCQTQKESHEVIKLNLEVGILNTFLRNQERPKMLQRKSLMSLMKFQQM